MEDNRCPQVQWTRRSLRLRWCMWVVLAITSLAIAVLAWVFFTLPDVKQLAAENPEITSYMQLHTAHQEPEHSPVPLQWTGIDAISPLVVCAVVKAEDTMFFRH